MVDLFTIQPTFRPCCSEAVVAPSERFNLVLVNAVQDGMSNAIVSCAEQGDLAASYVSIDVGPVCVRQLSIGEGRMEVPVAR